MVGSLLDQGDMPDRWERWRPTVDLFRHDDFLVARFELLHLPRDWSLAGRVATDIAQRVTRDAASSSRPIEIGDPWDFEQVYGALHDFARAYAFAPDREDYLVHVTTGTHVVQICLFLLTESRHIPARLVQASPRRRRRGASGTLTIIDLDLSKYDRLASRFVREQREGLSFLKSGIDTRNAAFNRLMEQIERSPSRRDAPILLTGPTGAGKSRLARRIYELKRSRRLVSGELRRAQLRDAARRRRDVGALRASPRRVHRRAAGSPGAAARRRQGAAVPRRGRRARRRRTGDAAARARGEDVPAARRRPRSAQRLPARSPARTAISAAPWPRAASATICSRASTSGRSICRGSPRGAKTSSRTSTTSSNASAPIEPACAIQRSRATRAISPSRCSARARWPGNFRDLNASIVRMATLADGGRITERGGRRRDRAAAPRWSGGGERRRIADRRARPRTGARRLDRFDRVQLEDVRVCSACQTLLSEAGRLLFSVHAGEADGQRRRSAAQVSRALRSGVAADSPGGAGGRPFVPWFSPPGRPRVSSTYEHAFVRGQPPAPSRWPSRPSSSRRRTSRRRPSHPPSNLVVDGIPAIPASLVEEVRPLHRVARRDASRTGIRRGARC